MGKDKEVTSSEEILLTVFLGMVFLLTMFFSMFSVLPMVAATNITSPSNNTNSSITMTITCYTSLQNVRNVTIWYNATNPGDVGSPTGSSTLYTQANTSANQTIFTNVTVSLVSLTDTVDYSFMCQFKNETASFEQNTTFTVGVGVDNTAPTAELYTGFSNATAKKNTELIILNITVNDATLGLADGGVCIIDVNGTNQTVDLTKSSSTRGTCNSSAINLTSHADDNRQIRIYVNDSLNYVLNQSIYIAIDTTNPTATASCTPDPIAVGNTITCTCTGTDALSGVSTSSATATPSTAETGGYSYGCTVTDAAGNLASQTATYTVSGGSNNGGTTGGGTTTLVKQIHSWSKMTPGTVAIMKDFNRKEGK